MENNYPIANGRVFLSEHGIKVGIVDKLNDEQVMNIVSFALDHITISDLSRLIVLLASMELSKKPGSAFLASNGIATPEQLKNLSEEQVYNIAEDYRASKDEKEASRAVRDAIISGQQRQISFHEGTDFESARRGWRPH